MPVHLHPYYRRRFGYGEGLCPVAERAYEEILSLPMFPAMTGAQVRQVIEAVYEGTERYAA
jgi:dTDP-4-amino-4,6-dideoxygalactose transaminase